MKHWCKLPAKHLDNEKLFELSESAQLCFYRLHHIATRADADGYLLNDDGEMLSVTNIAFRLHSTKPATEANLAELNRAGLIIADATGICIPDFSCEAADLTNAERQRRFRERRALPTPTPTVTNHPESNNNEQDSASNGVTITQVTPLCNTEEKRREEEEKRREEKKAAAAAKKPQSEKTATAATATLESEAVKIWQEWSNAPKIAPSFADRINQNISDLDVWRETLIFGAKHFKIPHTNVGLDWAIQNYRQSVSKKRADAIQNQPKTYQQSQERPEFTFLRQFTEAQ